MNLIDHIGTEVTVAFDAGDIFSPVVLEDVNEHGVIVAHLRKNRSSFFPWRRVKYIDFNLEAKLPSPEFVERVKAMPKLAADSSPSGELERARVGDTIRIEKNQKFSTLYPFEGSEWVVVDTSRMDAPPHCMLVKNPTTGDEHYYYPMGSFPYTIVKRAVDAERAKVGDVVRGVSGAATYVVTSVDDEKAYTGKNPLGERYWASHGYYTIVKRADAAKEEEAAKIGDTIEDKDGNLWMVEFTRESDGMVGGSQQVLRNSWHGNYTIVKRAEEEQTGVHVLTTEAIERTVAEMQDTNRRLRALAEHEHAKVGDTILCLENGTRYVVTKAADDRVYVDSPIPHLCVYQGTYIVVKRAGDAEGELSTAKLVDMLKERGATLIDVTENQVFSVQRGLKGGRDMYNYYSNEPAGPATILVVTD